MAKKKKLIGIVFGFEGIKSSVIKSGYGGGSDLGKFGGQKPRNSGISGALMNMEVEYAASRKEFFQFASDLWIAIVRNSVWHPKAPGPSPLNMIFTRITKDGVDFGWRNYPSESKSAEESAAKKNKPYTGASNAKIRFDARAVIFERLVKETGTVWFTEGARKGSTQSTRAVIASQRIRAAITEVMSMTSPSGQEMPFQVPIRSGQKSDPKKHKEAVERLHPNATKAESARESRNIKLRSRGQTAKQRFEERSGIWGD